MSITCLIVPGLITSDERDGLFAEAFEHRPEAPRRERDHCQIVDGRQFLGPARYWYSVGGELREKVLFSLPDRIAAATSISLHPVQSNYLYYGRGDHLGLHHDQARSPLTVVALLGGDAEPLCVHPELVGAPLEELPTWADPQTHRGGRKMFLQDGPLLLSGGIVPHHRDPHEGADEITLVTFSFDAEEGR